MRRQPMTPTIIIIITTINITMQPQQCIKYIRGTISILTNRGLRILTIPPPLCWAWDPWDRLPWHRRLRPPAQIITKVIRLIPRRIMCQALLWKLKVVRIVVFYLTASSSSDCFLHVCNEMCRDSRAKRDSVHCACDCGNKRNIVEMPIWKTVLLEFCTFPHDKITQNDQKYNAIKIVCGQFSSTG